MISVISKISVISVISVPKFQGSKVPGQSEEPGVRGQFLKTMQKSAFVVQGQSEEPRNPGNVRPQVTSSLHKRNKDP